MEANVYPRQTRLASEKFSLGQTIHSPVRAILVFMGKTKPPLERVFFIREWARAVGKRQRDVVAFTGLNKGYVSLIWSGKKRPAPDALARIAAALGVRPPGVLMMNPALPEARAVAAMARIPKEQQETAVEMLEGLADRRRA